MAISLLARRSTLEFEAGFSYRFPRYRYRKVLWVWRVAAIDPLELARLLTVFTG